MVIIYTRAYNAENTIRRTIECVLNQTYGDFRYILYNNGSLDSTLDIMREYASRDNRVIILSRDANMVSFNSALEILKFIVNNYSDEDYFCNIDADDVYELHFFEHMMSFVKKHKLDMAFCGYNVLERGTDRLIERKVLDRDIIMKNEELPQYFMTYRRYTTDVWAKFFKVSLLSYYLEKDRFVLLKNRNHTQQNFIYDALLNSTKVGMLAEPLLNYYVSDIAQKNMRMVGNVSLFQTREIFAIMNDFLNHFQVEEAVYQRNQFYLYAIYCGYITDTIAILQITNAMSLTNKINYFFDIFTFYVTKKMLKTDAPEEFRSLRSDEKEKMCQSVVDYVYSQEGWQASKDKVEMIVDTMQECGIKVQVKKVDILS